MSARTLTTYEIEAALLRSLADEVARFAETDRTVDSLREQLREQEDRVVGWPIDLDR